MQNTGAALDELICHQVEVPLAVFAAKCTKNPHYFDRGTTAGNLLLHSMDRAEEVYESMCLRGFENTLIDSAEIKFRIIDFIILVLTAALIIFFRAVPVFTLLGGLFV